MSKFYKKMIFMVLVVITITAMLLSGPPPTSSSTILEPSEAQQAETVAWLLPVVIPEDGDAMPCGYTWAG
jgi:hypothetical protein